MESLQDVPPMVPESKFRVPLVGLVSGESYNRRKGWFKIGHVSDDVCNIYNNSKHNK